MGYVLLGALLFATMTAFWMVALHRGSAAHDSSPASARSGYVPTQVAAPAGVPPPAVLQPAPPPPPHQQQQQQQQQPPAQQYNTFQAPPLPPIWPQQQQQYQALQQQQQQQYQLQRAPTYHQQQPQHYYCDPSPAVMQRTPSPHEALMVAPPTGQTNEDGQGILFYVTALYDYTATIDEAFDFQAGDLIAVTATPEDGWWSGELLDEDQRQKGS